MSPESKDLGETTLRIRQQFRSTTILIPAYGSPGGFSLLTKCNSRCDTCMQYASACGMSLCTTQPFVGSHINTFVTHTRGTTMTLGILSRSKQNARQHGARTEHVRSTYGARTEHVGKNHEMRTPPLLKIRGYNIKTLITVESLHFVVFPNVLRTCSVRASYVLRTCSVRAASHGWCWG